MFQSSNEDLKWGQKWVYERMLYFPRGEYARRREKLWQLWGRDKPILLFGRQTEGEGQSHQWSTFEYFTGYRDPGAAALLVPSGKTGFKTYFFLAPINEHTERWEGRRFDQKRERSRVVLGCDQVYSMERFDSVLKRTLGRGREVGAFVAVDRYNKEHWEFPESRELKAFLKKHHLKSVSTSTEVAKLRKIKSDLEVEAHTEADRITGEALKYALANWKAYRNEAEIQADIQAQFRKGGALELAYYPIVADGYNATVLHYRNNDCDLGRSTLMLMDVGCRYHGYCADITRGFPRAGTFNKRQKQLYNLVLAAQLKAISKVRPGATWEELNDTAWGHLKKAGFERWHGVGHFLGMDVHDVGDYKVPLEPGCAITIEPGIYIPDEGIGIRIEDDVLVTKTGAKVMSSMIPKSVDDIERLIRRR